jgi:PAS domain S-box-containing protein
VSRILGRKPQEIVGRALSDFCVEPEDLTRLEDALEALRNNGGYLKHLEYCVVNREGRLRRLRTYAEATVDARGNFVGIRGVSLDVTDREPF